MRKGRVAISAVFVVIAAMAIMPVLAAAALVPVPTVLYTDLASGPNSGGEGGEGTFLSIFGKNFGSGGLGTTLQVTIGDSPVYGYRYLGPSKGRADIQQITVQIGALTGQPLGTPLPVRVSVDGVASNADVTFTINPGRILFVDNVHGDDSSAVPDDVDHPYRHVQLPSGGHAAYDAMQPGDIIMMRGGITPWTDHGNDTYFVKFIGKSASAPSGTSGTGPYTLMAYPDEDVFIDLEGDVAQKGAIGGVDTRSYSGGRWITLAGLRIESGGDSGVIAVQVDGDHWRIVNNELTAATATVNAKAAGINGSAMNAFWVGNHIHEIAGGVHQENHGIYIDCTGSYEIAYNVIENVSGGNGLQTYLSDESVCSDVSNVDFHHNRVHGISKFGINIADGTQGNIRIWNNVIYDTAYSSLRFNTTSLHGARIYNNTFYDAVTTGNSNYGAIANTWSLPADAIDMRNNILVPTAGRDYATGFDGSIGTITNNLYFDGGSGFAFDANPVHGDPMFADTATADLHPLPGSAAIDAGSSAVAGLVGNDFDATTARPCGADYDIGAFEYDPDHVPDRIFGNDFE
jgi:hypothetical protein